MKNLKSKKFAERSAWMVIYIILLNGRDIQSMYLRIVLSHWTNVILGHRILGNQKKIFMQRIKLKISKPNSDSCQRRQRKGKESQWKNHRLILTLTLMTYQSVRFSIFFDDSIFLLEAPPPKSRAKKTTTRSGRVSKKASDPVESPKPSPRGRPKGKSPVSVKESAPVVLEDLNYDDFYEKLNVRVPPSTYDTSDFDRSHLFHIRMSNYLR